ncbi:hypothetical protein GCM10011352_22300 [Marinobacterium zhoushanense]|uniref:Uncharacterized protein n=1 Tax=Marinobacterium zhoushanense TaxID=1679163 RepID=A0ABQ1KCQ4_9GAMM|nr:hypothetical protein [Marinobacterium zhoushanense]GGB95753.1 hypothetical protein GCM10011352_22300 [Marinobacterium zhoushanense]
MRRSTLFGWLRLSLLSVLLVILALYLLLSSTRSVDWHDPVVVHIYPINADRQDSTARYIASLTPESFRDIESFFSREGARYEIELTRPVRVHLAPAIEALPPRVPEQASIVQALWWAVRMRLWVWRYDSWNAADSNIRIFMSFYAPDNPLGTQHSLGLQKGMIGLVNGYASEQQQGINNFVAAHELLHTLGASDKYDVQSGKPLWPDGFADPVQAPLFPQQRAEIMGGRVQVTPGWSLLPPSLDHAVVGAATAIEIGWLAAKEE